VGGPREAGGLLDEVLAQHRLLPLVIRAEPFAVQHIWRLEHSLEGELADGLPVLDHERHVARPDLERRSRAVAPALWVVAEAGVEEAGVMRSQLPGRRVIGRHLCRVPGGYARALGRQEQVENLRLEDDALAGLWVHRLPVVAPAVSVHS